MQASTVQPFRMKRQWAGAAERRGHLVAVFAERAEGYCTPQSVWAGGSILRSSRAGVQQCGREGQAKSKLVYCLSSDVTRAQTPGVLLAWLRRLR